MGEKKKDGEGKRKNHYGGGKDYAIELHSSARRQMEDGENGAREGMQRGRINGRSVAREQCIARAISMQPLAAGFNIKRFYEPNKKAINRFRLDRHEGRQMMYRAVRGLTYNKGLSRGAGDRSRPTVVASIVIAYILFAIPRAIDKGPSKYVL